MIERLARAELPDEAAADSDSTAPLGRCSVPLDGGGRPGRDDRLGHAVRLSLVGVAGLANGELRLDG